MASRTPRLLSRRTVALAQPSRHLITRSPCPLSRVTAPIPAFHLRRNFSTTRPDLATNTVLNPRTDEHGSQMTIDILPRAIKRLQWIADKDHNPSLCLRVSVESGGCHGFQYLMSLTNLDKVSKQDDTLFETCDESGKANDQYAARVVMDEASLELLKGSKVDYSMELIGSQFKVVGIPGATSSCGCGTSFDVKL